jgi:hypothetical protein
MESNDTTPELGFFDATIVWDDDTITPFEYVPDNEDEADLIQAVLDTGAMFTKQIHGGTVQIEAP